MEYAERIISFYFVHWLCENLYLHTVGKRELVLLHLSRCHFVRLLSNKIKLKGFTYSFYKIIFDMENISTYLPLRFIIFRFFIFMSQVKETVFTFTLMYKTCLLSNLKKWRKYIFCIDYHPYGPNPIAENRKNTAFDNN